MANSSDWLAALLERPPEDSARADAPAGWLDALAQPGAGFVEGIAFGSDSAKTRQAHDGPTPFAKTPETDTNVHTETDSGEGPGDLAPPVHDPIGEAFTRGEAAGRAAALAENEALRSQQFALRQSFRALDQAALDVLASELAETVIALCGQVLADYEPAPETLRARCLEAAKRLGSGADRARLHMHPDDLALLGEDGIAGWEIVADPSAERGGVRFETEDGCVSDSPSDWRRAIAAAIRG